jgi:SAM-dependent methyltransferase
MCRVVDARCAAQIARSCERTSEGRVGAPVDYERHGRTYARHRRADPRIAQRIQAALGDARTVLNVGAGCGSYEPDDRWVLAVEPSATMRAQRPEGSAPAIAARAEALPFDDNAVDAAMACVTIHHWESPDAGLAELRRVARGPVVVFTFELEHLPAWQLEFLREGVVREMARFPAIDRVAAALGEAFWRRPELLLDPQVRSAQSIWALLEPDVEQRIVQRLAGALDSGAWDAEHGHLRERDSFDGALRLVISEAP